LDQWYHQASSSRACSHLSAGADFPPIGATNKIFYVGVAATLIGIFQDLLPQIKNYSKILAALLSLSIVGWIAYPCLAKPKYGPRKLRTESKRLHQSTHLFDPSAER
jgi:hypothetical protein